MVLEMVRRGPSASNKQPWRVVRAGERWHLYLQRTRGYGRATAGVASPTCSGSTGHRHVPLRDDDRGRWG